MKRIFVCEFITCGGLRDSELTSPLFADAELMYQALLADLRKIEYLEIITTRDDRLIPVSESVANIEERQKHTRDTGSGRIRFGPQFHGDPKKHQKEAAELYLKANKPRDALRVYGEKAFDMLKKEGNHKLLAEVYDGKGDSLRTKRMTRKANSKSRLTSRLTGVIAIVGVLGGITFLSPSITGNAIAGIAPKGSSFLGIGLLAIGICAGVFSIKRKS